MAFLLEGKNAVITGGARGIGRAIAERYLNEGASLYLIDIHEENLRNTQSELAALAGNNKVEIGWADVGKSADVARCVDEAYSLLSSIDIVVSNAGVAFETPFLKVEENELNKIIDVNLKGMFLVCQGFARRMVSDSRILKEGGRIITMGSKNGLVGEPGYTHYGASKGGVIALTRAMAAELAPYNITVNCVCPGYLVTPMSQEIDDPQFARSIAHHLIPSRRSGNVEDVTGTFVFLATDDARWIIGQTIVIDGGQTCVSGNLPMWYEKHHAQPRA